MTETTTEILEFIIDGCVRLNDSRAVENCDREMLAEELTEIEDTARRALASLRGEDRHIHDWSRSTEHDAIERCACGAER